MVTCTQQHDYVGVLLSGGPAGVVQEVVLGQHLEHVVAAALQEGGPGSLHLARRDVAELEVALLPPAGSLVISAANRLISEVVRRRPLLGPSPG